jgi:hypothetical protein
MWFLRLKTAICVNNTTRLRDAALEVGRLTDVVCVYTVHSVYTVVNYKWQRLNRSHLWK